MQNFIKDFIILSYFIIIITVLLEFYYIIIFLSERTKILRSAFDLCELIYNHFYRKQRSDSPSRGILIEKRETSGTARVRPRAHCDTNANGRMHACAYVRKSCWHLGTRFLSLSGSLRVLRLYGIVKYFTGGAAYVRGKGDFWGLFHTARETPLHPGLYNAYHFSKFFTLSIIINIISSRTNIKTLNIYAYIYNMQNLIRKIHIPYQFSVYRVLHEYRAV